jgi:hypothetical protein
MVGLSKEKLQHPAFDVAAGLTENRTPVVVTTIALQPDGNIVAGIF